MAARHTHCSLMDTIYIDTVKYTWPGSTKVCAKDTETAAMDSLYRDLFSLFEAIDTCLDRRLSLPALILIYSSIDIIASLERLPMEGTRESFTRWTDRYLLHARPLPCTALELYAARCGVLHTLSAESDLSRGGKARRISYAWGTARTENLETAFQRSDSLDIIVVHISELAEALRLGLANYLDEIDIDPQRAGNVARSAGLWLASLSSDRLRDFLNTEGTPS